MSREWSPFVCRRPGKPLACWPQGFGHESGSQAAIERLGLRATLATTALVLRERNREAAGHEARQNAVLQASGATILIDYGGASWDSAAAPGVARRPRRARGATRNPMDGHWKWASAEEEICRAISRLGQARVRSWLHSGQAPASVESGIDSNPPHVELGRGRRGQLRHLESGGGLTALSLEPLEEDRSRFAARTRRDTAVQRDRVAGGRRGAVRRAPRHSRHEHPLRADRRPDAGGTQRITTLNGLIARLADQAAEPEQFAERWREQARGADGGVREEIQLLRPVPRVLERADAPDHRCRRTAPRPRGNLSRSHGATRLPVQAAANRKTCGARPDGHRRGARIEQPADQHPRLRAALVLAQRRRSSGPDEVQQIFQEAERASTIVRQLLMTARDSRPERRRVALNQVVSRTLDLQRFSLAAEKVRVEQDLDPNLAAVLGDAGQLQQVLMNLIGNSRQAIEQAARAARSG